MSTNRLSGWPVLLDLAYLFALGLAAPYYAYKLIATDKYREGLPQRLGLTVPPRAGAEPCLWVHGVSVGEVMAARAMVEGFRRRFPGWRVAVSTTTKTGQAVARKTLPECHIFYFPLDFSWAVRRAFDAVRPSAVVLMELELWPGFLAEAERREVPVHLVNGRISEKSFRGYQRGRGLARLFLDRVELWLVQQDVYRERLLALGVPSEKVRVTGNMKYDNLPRAADPAKAWRALAPFGIAEGEPVFLGASTHEPEEERLAEVHRRLTAARPELRFVVVPRHPERGEAVARALQRSDREVVRFSQEKGGSSRSVLVVDAIGVLADLYPAAAATFVGGSWTDRGGQNVLEPAACGVPVFVGPGHRNFKDEVCRLAAAGGLEVVPDEDALAARLEALLAGPQERTRMGRAAKASVEGLRGASERNLDILMEAGLGAASRVPADSVR